MGYVQMGRGHGMLGLGVPCGVPCPKMGRPIIRKRWDQSKPSHELNLNFGAFTETP